MLRRESLRTPGRRIRRLGLTTLLCVTACADRASRGSEDVAGDGDGEPGTGDGDGEPGTGDGDGEPHEQPCESEHDGMICIPAGPFIMGSSGLAYLGELEIPEQQVEMSRYHIDRHEVTFGEYRACVDAGVCTPPTVENPDDDLTLGCRWSNPDIDEYPVACIEWPQARAYCQWRGADLPTEAQWEKAGRGTDGRSYPWGNEEPSCQYASMASDLGEWGCGSGMAQLPGSHSPQGDSPYGVQDMVGNVQELVLDWLGPGQPKLGTDPVGPARGTWKVAKGGAFHVTQEDNENGDWLHLPWRGQGGWPQPGLQLGPMIGFRCAISG